jgi:hypothetical protein
VRVKSEEEVVWAEFFFQVRKTVVQEMASSVSSSRIRNLRAAQNTFRMRSEEAVRTARLAQDLIDEEELELKEQEAAEDAKLMLQAAKAKAELMLQAAKAKAELML